MDEQQIIHSLGIVKLKKSVKWEKSIEQSA